jgi:hydrogenase expression/formation protein HypE
VTVSDRERRVLAIIETARSKRPRFRDERITMAHGAGGKATQALVEGLLAPAFGMTELADAALLDGDLALTTDSFVVKPLRFPGGSIGELAINGTVNDLAVAGARPIAVSVALILEEGLPTTALRAEVEAIAGAAEAAGVAVVAGDTKVVERGHGDGMYVCTTGIGRRDPRADLHPAAVRPGDRILVSGSVGEHGTAIMLARGELGLEADVESDTRPLWPAVDALLDHAPRCLRDATRGGVATVLNEIARDAGVSMLVRESDVPVAPGVAGASELLGIDPMYVANEGAFVAFVAPEAAGAALAALRAVPGCERAAEIGEVRAEPPAMVLIDTAFGGRRVMDMLAGDPLRGSADARARDRRGHRRDREHARRRTAGARRQRARRPPAAGGALGARVLIRAGVRGHGRGGRAARGRAGARGGRLPGLRARERARRLPVGLRGLRESRH